MAKSEVVASTRWTGHRAVARFNSLTHGLCARLVVLAHEDHAEFDDLLAALVEEHKPEGPTQQHLVEELAAVIWRKRRVLLAEGASINSRLAQVRDWTGVVQAADPFNDVLSGDRTTLAGYMADSPEQLAAQAKAAERLRESTWKVGRDALAGLGYDEAVAALEDEPRKWWLGRNEDEREDYADTVRGLIGFLDAVVLPYYDEIVAAAPIAHAIKAQAYGKGLTSMETLNRYEVHLDRKFERTLGMLLKLKGLLPA